MHQGPWNSVTTVAREQENTQGRLMPKIKSFVVTTGNPVANKNHHCLFDTLNTNVSK